MNHDTGLMTYIKPWIIFLVFNILFFSFFAIVSGQSCFDTWDSCRTPCNTSQGREDLTAWDQCNKKCDIAFDICEGLCNSKNSNCFNRDSKLKPDPVQTPVAPPPHTLTPTFEPIPQTAEKRAEQLVSPLFTGDLPKDCVSTIGFPSLTCLSGGDFQIQTCDGGFCFINIDIGASASLGGIGITMGDSNAKLDLSQTGEGGGSSGAPAPKTLIPYRRSRRNR